MNTNASTNETSINALENKIIKQFTIINARGLHARAATKLVRLASEFPCEILLSGPDLQPANAKSVMGVLLLCGSQGTTIEVTASGPDAEKAISAIGLLIEDRFGEPE